MDELHASVDPTANSGTFRTRLYTAVKYGLLEFRIDRRNDRREVFVTPLGEEILNPTTERRARVLAFLNVPVHRLAYIHFDGKILPDDAEIERYMVYDLGVSSGQVDNIRRVFKRSAKQAGFFEQRRDQLLLPADVSLADDEMPGPTQDADSSFAPPESSARVDTAAYLPETARSGPDATGRVAVHPLLDYLWAELVRDSATMTTETRNDWLETFERNFRHAFRDRR